MDDVTILDSVLAKDTALMRAVRTDQLTNPTPCPEYDVAALLQHLAGWLRVFAGAATGRVFEGDPAAFTSSDPAAEFEVTAAELLSGWRSNGVDRSVRMTGAEMPAQMVLSMTLMEYVTHGCDLAVATGRLAPFDDDELSVTLDRARATLPDQFRGEGMPFGYALEVAPDASVLEQLLGFMGRDIGTRPR